MSSAFVTMGDGCRLSYCFDGDPRAPVLLLSNSLGTTMDMWAYQVPHFAKRFRVLRYDSRGHGRSDAPVGSYSVDRLGRDVVELLDQLEVPRITFVGLSKGGMIGQWLGWRLAERVERLVLANTSAYMGPSEAWDRRIRTVSEHGMNAISDSIIERWFRPAFRSHEKVALVRDMLLNTPAHGYIGCCAAIRDMDHRQLVALVEAPTLVIAGSDDPATPLDHALLMVDRIKRAELVVLEAAHLSNIEQADEFSKAVLNFCA